MDAIKCLLLSFLFLCTQYFFGQESNIERHYPRYVNDNQLILSIENNDWAHIDPQLMFRYRVGNPYVYASWSMYSKRGTRSLSFNYNQQNYPFQTNVLGYNAMTIIPKVHADPSKGFKMGIGTSNPLAPLHLYTGQSMVGTSNINQAAFLISTSGDFGLGIDGNEITHRNHILHISSYADPYSDSEGKVERTGSIDFITGPVDDPDVPSKSVKMSIHRDGYVGIGTTTPNSKLNIYGGRATIQRSDAGGNAVLELSTALETDTKSGSNTNYIFTNATDGALVLRTDISTQDVQIQNNATSGNVLIGDLSDPNFTYTTKQKLMVNGNIAARGIKIYPSGHWPDYVFDKDYSLQPLSEVESYITENKKLPAIPSAQEIKEKGMDMPELQRLQMQKIEELTLYAIAQQKQIEELIKRNKEQEKRIQKLEKK